MRILVFLFSILFPIISLQSNGFGIEQLFQIDPPPKSLLEFGLGPWTQNFLEACSNVTSVELVPPSNDQSRFQKYLDTYKSYPNWHSILKVGSFALQQSDERALKGLDPSLYDGGYLFELKDLCDDLFREKSYEVVFVNPGIHLRGDLINELFGRAPIIVAHDTNYSDRIYGWIKISTPFDYIRLDDNQGYGTTFWIHKSREDLIKKLLPSYVEQKPKKLRIFFPEIHGELVKSMIFVCQHLGHTLVLPGASFQPNDPRGVFNLRYGVVTKQLENLPLRCRKNVEIIESDKLFANPPDVFFINCEDVEEDILNITKWLKNVKIAHYSGNNNVPYSSKHLKNLISADATTVYQYKMDELHYSFWIPWIDWPSLEYTGPNTEGTIDTYLGKHYLHKAFFPAKRIYESYTAQYEKSHRCSPFILHDWVDSSEMFASMEKSIGVIHIKNHEGFGYTIVQSLAKGRPVFLKRSYSVGKKLMNWCIDGQTALFFDDYEEFERVIDRYLRDASYREHLQNQAARQIRRMIQNERQALIFENFIQNLR